MKNTAEIKECYGCGVCAAVCPRRLIDIVHNKDGFYHPIIENLEICTECGLCLEVCSYLNDCVENKPQSLKSYAAWSQNSVVRRICSSGGAGFEISRNLLEQGYKVCAVRYNSDANIAEHYIANTIEELLPSIGSKYIQSYTLKAFREIKRNEKYLIVGTPCQIDSLRRYIKRLRIEQNVVLIDFFCHGVPTYLIWDKYINDVQSRIGKASNVVWRHKKYGWHDSWAMSVDSLQSSQSEYSTVYGIRIKEMVCEHFSRMSQGDDFYSLFLGNNCLNKACYNNCKFKYTNSSADIRIGDLWGEEYKCNEEGVSALISLTPKGDDILLNLEGLEKLEHPLNVVAEGQMKDKIRYPYLARPIVLSMLKANFSLKNVAFVSRAFAKLRRIFK